MSHREEKRDANEQRERNLYIYYLIILYQSIKIALTTRKEAGQRSLILDITL